MACLYSGRGRVLQDVEDVCGALELVQCKVKGVKVYASWPGQSKCSFLLTSLPMRVRSWQGVPATRMYGMFGASAMA